jgi:hypothetical protein
MGNLPTLKVLLDNAAATGLFPFDITAYVMAIDGYQLNRGRDDWQSAVTAGELSLTLNNSDGRFTPGSTLIASPTPIVVDRRIRVQEIVNGVTYTRFTGYVKSWPVEWSETVASFAKVRLSAVDAQARGERRPLRSLATEEIMIDNPTAYYPLSEPAAATTAGDASGHTSPPLAITGSGTALTFGTTLGVTDGLSCVQFNGGTYLHNTIPSVYVPTGAAYTLECFFSNSATTANTAILMSVDAGMDGFTGSSLFIGINPAGKLVASGAGFTSSASVNDGVVHHAFYAVTAGGVGNLFLDGVSVAFGASAFSTASDFVGFSLAPSAIPFLTSSFVGTIAHAVVYPSAVGAARPAIHGAARNGFLGETGTARLTRHAGYAGIPVGTLDTSLSNMAANIDASTAWGEIQAAADAEFGVAYIDGTGALTFHNRNRVVSKTVPDLTLSSQWVTPDVAPVSDDQQLVNYMEVSSEQTDGVSLARNITSETSHGRYPGSRSFMVQTDAEALDRANWLVSKLAEPTTRYGTLTINLYGMTPALASSVVNAIDVDCWLRVTSMASQNPGGTTADVIVQAFTETVNGDTWTIACNVVSQALYSPAWILDDPVNSILGTTTVLYV